MKESYSGREPDNLPDWKARLIMGGLSLALATGGAFAIRNYLSGELTAAGHESVPLVAIGMVSVGALGVIAALTKKG